MFGLADKHDVDTIVVGSLQKVELSISHLEVCQKKIVRYAKVPVLVVK